MNTKNLIVFVFIGLINYTANGQKASNNKIKKIFGVQVFPPPVGPFDSTYIRTYPSRIGVVLPVSTPFLKFSLRDWKSKRRLDFSPNQQYDFGVGINLKYGNIVLGTGIAYSVGDAKIKGRTKYTDIQAHLYLRRVATDIYYQKYKGFFVQNSRNFPGYTSNKPYEIRPDIHASMFAISSNYVLNSKKFSYRNSFGFSETQLKSAGSILLGAYYSNFNVIADSSFVSASFKSAFHEYSQIKDGFSQTFGISIGYIYTLVFAKNYYFTASVTQGVGLNGIKYNQNKGPLDNGKKSASKTSLRFAWGYDTGTFFAGGMAFYDFYNFSNHTDNTFDYSNGKIRVYVGYRFGFKPIKLKKKKSK